MVRLEIVGCTYVRMQECLESLKIIDQCLIKLNHELKRDRVQPRALVPKNKTQGR